MKLSKALYLGAGVCANAKFAGQSRYKLRQSREENQEKRISNPVWKKTTGFWTVRAPVHEKFILLESCEHVLSNVISRISAKGKLCSDSDRTKSKYKA